MEEEAGKLDGHRVFMQGEAVCLGALFYADTVKGQTKILSDFHIWSKRFRSSSKGRRRNTSFFIAKLGEIENHFSSLRVW